VNFCQSVQGRTRATVTRLITLAAPHLHNKTQTPQPLWAHWPKHATDISRTETNGSLPVMIAKAVGAANLSHRSRPAPGMMTCAGHQDAPEANGERLRAAWRGFHLRVVLHEEPWLRRQFTAEWGAYSASVPRWLPRLTPDKDEKLD
jgi:hypothetical protein